MTQVARSEADRVLSLENVQLSIPALGARPIPISAVEPSPCTQACPAGIQVKSYVSLIAEERFERALQVVRERCPLPGVCGRVCTHPCEEACRRGRYDDPIAIRALKRFVADRELEFEREPLTPPEDRGARVAIIGSGPAGLTAAWDLRRAGYGVTIFEAETEPGGMLRHGIADYRLPPDVLEHEIDFILRAGIELRTGTRLGHDLELEALLHRDYRATILATGAQLGRRLGLEKEAKTEAVDDAIAFLRRLNAGEREDMGGRVLVVGGGSTAIEAARAALRLGATQSHILYRRTQEQMPASSEEVVAARAEGVEFSFLVAPSRLLLDGHRLVGLECARIELGAPDASGRPRPVVIAGSEFVVEGERVLAAIGQEVDLSFLPTRGRAQLADGGRLHVDAHNGATRLAGVFAAGDLLSGPSTVIAAIATGHRAAESVRDFLEHRDVPTGTWTNLPWPSRLYELPDAPPRPAGRVEPALRPLDMKHAFAEVEEAFTADEAVAEASRCLRCGPCDECSICAPGCSRRHVAVRSPGDEAGPRRAVVRTSSTLALSLDADRPTRGTLIPDDGSPDVPIELMPFRTSVLAPECRGCEQCVAICPFGAVHTEGANGSVSFARVDPARCRGCNLCTSVCPTGAMRAAVFSPDRWQTSPRGWTHAATTVLLCEHRVEALGAELPALSENYEILRLRCLGQLEPGLILDVFRQGSSRVIVGGCSRGSCRFQHGPDLADEALDQAWATLPVIGHDAADLIRLGEGPP